MHACLTSAGFGKRVVFKSWEKMGNMGCALEILSGFKLLSQYKFCCLVNDRCQMSSSILKHRLINEVLKFVNKNTPLGYDVVHKISFLWMLSSGFVC